MSQSVRKEGRELGKPDDDDGLEAVREEADVERERGVRKERDRDR